MISSHLSRAEQPAPRVSHSSNDGYERIPSIAAAIPNRGSRRQSFFFISVAVVALIVSALTWHGPAPWLAVTQSNTTSTSVSYSFFHSRDNSSAIGNSNGIRQWVNKTNASGKWFVNIMWDVVQFTPRLPPMVGVNFYAWARDVSLVALKCFLFEARLAAKWIKSVFDVTFPCARLFLIYLKNAIPEGYSSAPKNGPNETTPGWIDTIRKYLFPEYSTSAVQTSVKSPVIQMGYRPQSLAAESNFSEKFAEGQPRTALDNPRRHEQSEMSTQINKSEGNDEDEEEEGEISLRLWRWLFTAGRTRRQTRTQEPKTSVLTISGDFMRSFGNSTKEHNESARWFALIRGLVTRALSSTMVSEPMSGSPKEEDPHKSVRVSTGKKVDDIVTAPNKLQQSVNDSVSLVTDPIIKYHPLNMTDDDDDGDCAVTQSNDTCNASAKDVIGPLNRTSSSHVVMEKTNLSCEGEVSVGHVDLIHATCAMKSMDEKCKNDVFSMGIGVCSHAKKRKSSAEGGGGGESITPPPIFHKSVGLCEVTTCDCARDLDEHEKKCQHPIVDAVGFESQRMHNEFEVAVAAKMQQLQSECLRGTVVAVREELNRVQRQYREHESKARELERQRLQKLCHVRDSINERVQGQSQFFTPAMFEKEMKHLLPQCNAFTLEALEVQAEGVQKANEESAHIALGNEKEDMMKQCHIATARAVGESIHALRTRHHPIALEERVRLKEECRQTTTDSVEKAKQEAKGQCEAQIASIVKETVQSLERKCHESTTSAIARKVEAIQKEHAVSQAKLIEQEKRLFDTQCEQSIREAVRLRLKKLQVGWNDSSAQKLTDTQEADRRWLHAACKGITAAAVAAEGHRLHTQCRLATSEQLLAQGKEKEGILARVWESRGSNSTAASVAQLQDAGERRCAACNLQAHCGEGYGKVNNGLLMQWALFASTALCVVVVLYALFIRAQLQHMAPTGESSKGSYAKTCRTKSPNVKCIAEDMLSGDDTVTADSENRMCCRDSSTDSFSSTANEAVILLRDILLCSKDILVAVMYFLLRVFAACLRKLVMRRVGFVDTIVPREAASMSVAEKQISVSIACVFTNEEQCRISIAACETNSRAALQCQALAALTAEIARLAAKSEGPQKERDGQMTPVEPSVSGDGEESHGEAEAAGLAEMMRDMLLAENRERHALQLELDLMRWQGTPSPPALPPLRSSPRMESRALPLPERYVPVMRSARHSPEAPGGSLRESAVNAVTTRCKAKRDMSPRK